MSMISAMVERLRETANDIFMNIDADFPVCKADGELMSEAADMLEMLTQKKAVLQYEGKVYAADKLTMKTKDKDGYYSFYGFKEMEDDKQGKV